MPQWHKQPQQTCVLSTFMVPSLEGESLFSPFAERAAMLWRAQVTRSGPGAPGAAPFLGQAPGPPHNRTLRAQARLEEMSTGSFAGSWEGEKSCPPSVYFHGGPELAECQILSACQSLKHSYEEFSLSDVLMPEGCAKHPTSRSRCRGSGKVLGFPPVGGLIKRGSLSHIQCFQSKSSVLIMPPKA